MALIKFFKTPKHQQFQYKTRYWDPRKEELEERLRLAEERQTNDLEATKSRIASGFRNKGYYHGKGNLRQRQTMRSNLLLFAVIVGLVFMVYVLLTRFLPQLVRMVEGQGGGL